MATQQINLSNIEQILTKSDIVVVDAWAAWCGPCRAFAPVFEAASARQPDVVWGKLNTEEEPGLASALNVRALPTLMVFRQGVLLFHQAGMLSGPALDELVAKARAVDMEEVRREVAEYERKQKTSARAANG